MEKIIYKVEFDPIKTDNLYFQERIVGEEYDVGNGTLKMVLEIKEKWQRRFRSVVILYEDGYEDEFVDIYHIYRKLILN